MAATLSSVVSASSSSTDFPTISVREIHYKIAVEAAGNAVWRGILPAIRKDGVCVREPIILFASKETGRCLGLPFSQISAHAIRKQVAESDALFASYQERAATFILRNFNRKSGMGLSVLVRGSEPEREVEREEEKEEMIAFG
jgi:hypothetical protein